MLTNVIEARKQAEQELHKYAFSLRPDIEKMANAIEMAKDLGVNNAVILQAVASFNKAKEKKRHEEEERMEVASTKVRSLLGIAHAC